MERWARLSFTSNPKLQDFVGCIGVLERNTKGGYDFHMQDNGKTICTTRARERTVLGDVDVPICRNLGFQTQSGTFYQFDFLDYERVVDGTRMEGNQYVGYEKERLAQILENAAGEAEAYHSKNTFNELTGGKTYGY